jgi:crotonobetainyl-CoA:carnitine CoA-transferase CaiB-like acyl-CoA transferase
MTDNETTYHIAFLIMAALAARDRTGEGLWIDAAQYEAGIGMIGDAYVAHALGAPVPVRAGNAESDYPFAGCYPCEGTGGEAPFRRGSPQAGFNRTGSPIREGPDAWITLVVQDRAAWSALGDLAGLPDPVRLRDPWQSPLSVDERVSLDEAITAWTRTRTPHMCLMELQRRGIASGVVNDVRDLLLDPHLEARGFYQLVQHAPAQGSGGRAWPGVSARLSATPGAVLRHAPMLGEHNRALALDLLGYAEAEYEQMAASGAMGTVPANAAVRPPAARTAERVSLGPWAMRRIKEYDPDFEERLRARFGLGFGRPIPVATGERERA